MFAARLSEETFASSTILSKKVFLSLARPSKKSAIVDRKINDKGTPSFPSTGSQNYQLKQRQIKLRTEYIKHYRKLNKRMANFGQPFEQYG